MTFFKLCQSITKCESFEEILKLSNSGNNNNVDMLVKDIYGTDYSNLNGDLIASSYGKFSLNQKISNADTISSLLKMISYNISQIVTLYSFQENINLVIFTGFFVNDNIEVIRNINFGIKFWSKEIITDLYLKNNGYICSLGAMLKQII